LCLIASTNISVSHFASQQNALATKLAHIVSAKASQLTGVSKLQNGVEEDIVF